MANNDLNSNRQSSFKKTKLYKEKNIRSGSWYVKAAKHPVLTAAAIAGLGSLIWNAAAKPKN